MDNNYAWTFLVHFTWNTFSIQVSIISILPIAIQITPFVCIGYRIFLYKTISLCSNSNGNPVVRKIMKFTFHFSRKMSSFCSISFPFFTSESSLLRSIETFTTFQTFIIRSISDLNLCAKPLCNHKISATLIT